MYSSSIILPESSCIICREGYEDNPDLIGEPSTRSGFAYSDMEVLDYRLPGPHNTEDPLPLEIGEVFACSDQKQSCNNESDKENNLPGSDNNEDDSGSDHTEDNKDYPLPEPDNTEDPFPIGIEDDWFNQGKGRAQ